MRLPTVTVACAKGGQTSRSGKRNGELLLTGMVKRLPTCTKADGGQHGYRYKRGNLTLTGAVKMPTVTSRDHKDNGPHTNFETSKKKGKLPGAVGGTLSPDWVEWYMGWPVFWTSLESSPPENFADWLNNHAPWVVEPVPSLAKKVKNRAKRIMALGNGQVPQTAALAWRLLAYNTPYNAANGAGKGCLTAG